MPLNDPEAFLAWLAKGPERSPRLYGRMEALVKPPTEEKKEAPQLEQNRPVQDFKMKSAGEGLEEMAELFEDEKEEIPDGEKNT